MKSYTDLEQSRKLVEFLPIESADMGHIPSAEEDDGNTLYTAEFKSEFIFDEDCCIPCWSLAALLNILPSSTLDSSDDHYYRVHCNEKFTEWHDNPIDACVEIIDRLHEQMIYDFNNNS